MARISYDETTAAGYKAVRELPREGLADWRDAVERHLRPTPGMTLVDIGAGTGQFSSALGDWFDIDVIAVEPSEAMRARIPRTPRIEPREGEATSLPLADESVDAAWMSLVIHHVADLEAAAREIRRVLRPGAPVLIRQGFTGRCAGIELVRWFPETERTIDTYPSVDDVCRAFATAGFRQDALEPVCELRPPAPLADLLVEVDTLRQADTSMRSLSEDEFLRGRERLRAATEPRSNWLDLLVLR